MDCVCAIQVMTPIRLRRGSNASWAASTGEHHVWIESLSNKSANDGSNDQGLDIPEDIGITEAIDFAIMDKWSKLGIKASPVAGDGTFCRRVYLDVVGRIPTYEEIKNFT